ncbi:MAG: hypothetical protein AAGH88_03435, partial [Planctomycetota bacterium]
MSIPYKIHGLQRTGTNLSQYLLSKNFDVSSCESSGEWKHGLCGSTHSLIDGQPLRYILCVKNPYAWIYSMYCYAKRAFGRDPTVDRKFNPNIEFKDFLHSPHYGFASPAWRWSYMYEHWLRALPDQRRFIIRHEDMLGTENQSEVLKNIADKFNLDLIGQTISTSSNRINIDCQVGKSMDTNTYLKSSYLKYYDHADLSEVHDSLNYA